MGSRKIFVVILALLAVGLLPIAAAADGLRVERDIQYYDGPDADFDRHILDVYAPAQGGPYPVLIFVHGGAWRIGDKDNPPHADLSRAFALRGLVCVNINYRMTPDVMFPEHARDVARAVAWTVGHVAEYNGDPTKIVISGHSAGAHLSALLALDPEYLAEVGLTPAVFSGVVGLSGPYDIAGTANDNLRRGALARHQLESVFGEDPDGWIKASPISHVAGPHAPMMLVVGDRDPLTPKEESRRFYDALEAARPAGAPPTELVVVRGEGHTWMTVRLAREGDETADRIEDFIRRVTQNK